MVISSELIDRLLQESQAVYHNYSEMEQHYNGTYRYGYHDIRELGPLLTSLRHSVNWSRTYVDSLEERLNVKKMRCPLDPELAEWSWNCWQANNLDEDSSLAHLEAFVQGNAWLTVTYDPSRSEFPTIACESANAIYAVYTPVNGNVALAIRPIGDKQGKIKFVRVYTEDSILFFELQNQRWKLVSEDYHGLGFVPVFPMLNKARLNDNQGRSELSDVIPIVNAASETFYKLNVAQEYLAMPQKWAIGVEEEDFRNANGEIEPSWKVSGKSIWASSNKDMKVGQFTGADLTSFHNTIRMHAQQFSAVTAVPMHSMGYSSDNPMSAEGIQAVYERFNKKARRKMRQFSAAWKKAFTAAVAMRFGTEKALKMRSFEMVWDRPETVSIAALMDYTQKGIASNVFPNTYGPEALDLPESEQERIRELQGARPLSNSERIVADLSAALQLDDPEISTVYDEYNMVDKEAFDEVLEDTGQFPVKPIPEGMNNKPLKIKVETPESSSKKIPLPSQIKFKKVKSEKVNYPKEG